jgi:hypothetical protein
VLPLPAVLQLARPGPLVPAAGIVLIALVLVGVALLVARPTVRGRWPWLLPELGAATALALLHVLFFWQPYRTAALVPRGGGDLASFFYPMHVFAAGEVQAGRMPFWNPYLFSGAPHLANFQTGLLYPPNLLAYLLARPFDYRTLELLAIGHFLLASYGVYWLARALGMSRAGGVLAGTIFAYSGFLVAHLGHFSMLATASWAPFVLAAIAGTVRRGSWPLALAGTLALACAILGGHQPILLMTLTAAVALALFEVWRLTGYAHPRALLTVDGAALRGWRDTPVVGSVARLAFMAVVATGLATPVLGPSLQLNAYTVRAGLDYRTASEFSVQPTALLHLVFPTIYGSNPTDYWGPFSNTEIWGYTGVLAIALALYGLYTRPTRTRLFWAAVGVVAFLFLLGPFTALHGWAYAFVPGYDRIRGAGRGFMFVDLAIALLAGFGLDGMLRKRVGWWPREARALRWGSVALAGALLVVVAVVIPIFAANVVGINDPTNRPIIALDNAIMLAVWLALGLVVALLVWRTAVQESALVLLVGGAIVLELFHATAPFNPTTDPILAGFEHQEVVNFLENRRREDSLFRIESLSPSWQPNLALLVGLEDIGGLFDPLALKAYDDVRSQVVQDRAAEQYRALNVRFIITDRDAPAPVGGAQRALQTEALAVWELPNPLPRAWVLGTEQAAEVVEARPGYLRLAIPPGADGQLVVSQTHYPGWTARVDGQRQEIGFYNVVLQTFVLPPGAREAVLTFRPERWNLWLGIGSASALVWLVACILTALPHVQARRRR